MLSSLEIKNFRTFSHLVIERLSRVNLIVGKNNVGKTTLLEALRIYGSIAPWNAIHTVLNKRNEVTGTAKKKVALNFRSLFHGRKVGEDDEVCIREQSTDTDQRGFVAAPEFESEAAKDNAGYVITHTDKPTGPFSRLALRVKHDCLSGSLSANGSALSVTASNPSPLALSIHDCDPDPPFLQGVGSQPHMEDTIATWWDAISLTAGEGRVVQAMQTITPVEAANFIGDPRENAGRFAIVREKETKEPAPLATLGDGAVRMFQIAVAMEYAAIRSKAIADAGVLAKNAFPLLLIDEVETGIHHTLHADLWCFIFKTAELLDVQVFATTHSHDCLKGFAEAITDNDENDGLVIRLEKVEGEKQTGAVSIDREGLPIIVRDSIEVR